MLEESLIASRPSARTRKPLTLLLSAITHGGLVVLLVLIPLFQSPLLPQVTGLDVLLPPQIRVTRLAATPPRDVTPAATPPRATTDLFAPIDIPKQIAFVDEAPVEAAGFIPSLDGTGVGNDLLNRLLITRGLNAGVSAPLPPPPPKPPVAATPEPAPPVAEGPVRLPGGQLEKSHLVQQVTPAYPILARQTRVQGNVILEAVITREGTIDPGRLRVISGHVLLIKAAEDAVKQWRYRPTLLNGQAVEIITTITISFRLE
jgi:protein TonB